MRKSRIKLTLLVAILVIATHAYGQNGSNNLGFSGTFSLLTYDNLKQGEFAGGLYFDNYDRTFVSDISADISNLALYGAYGITDDAELALRVPYSWLNIDDDYKDHSLGDVVLGGKYRFIYHEDSDLGAGGMLFVKFGTGDEEKIYATGETDFGARFFLTKGMGNLGFTLNAGYTVIGEPEDYDYDDEINYGGGITLKLSDHLTFITELTGSTAISEGMENDPLDITIGARLHTEKSLVVGLGARYALSEDIDHCPIGGVLNIGYYPWVPTPTPLPENHAPTVSLSADKTSIIAGNTVTINATASDPDGDTLYYKWYIADVAQASRGSTFLFDKTDTGIHVVRCTVDDGRGGMASDSVLMTVLPKVVIPKIKLEFKTEHFEFDNATLSEEYKEYLRKFAEAMMTDYRDMDVLIEGYTCPIGTEAYNLALGQRRADAVKDYLISLGVDESRIHTLSHGEDPQYLIVPYGSRSELAPNRRATVKRTEQD